MSDIYSPIIVRVEVRFPHRKVYKGVVYHLKCHVCGKEFTRNSNPTWKGGSYGLTCSKPCGRVLSSQKVSGENHGNWKGGGWKAQGYVRLNIRDDTGKIRTVYQHQLVAEQMLGRKLRKGEIVHHKNEDRSDNRPENLEVLTISNHLKGHGVYDKTGVCEPCSWCGKVVYRSRAKRQSCVRVFCSRECFASYRRGKPRTSE